MNKEEHLIEQMGDALQEAEWALKEQGVSTSSRGYECHICGRYAPYKHGIEHSSTCPINTVTNALNAAKDYSDVLDLEESNE